MDRFVSSVLQILRAQRSRNSCHGHLLFLVNFLFIHIKTIMFVAIFKLITPIRLSYGPQPFFFYLHIIPQYQGKIVPASHSGLKLPTFSLWGEQVLSVVQVTILPCFSLVPISSVLAFHLIHGEFSTAWSSEKDSSRNGLLI